MQKDLAARESCGCISLYLAEFVFPDLSPCYKPSISLYHQEDSFYFILHMVNSSLSTGE